jgi:hypothetical protein
MYSFKNPIQSWFSGYIDHQLFVMHDFYWKNGILCSPLAVSDKSVAWRNSEFAVRASIDYTTTWCEQNIGESIIDKHVLPRITLSSDLILDLGCGDGRYTKYFLNKGAQMIIAINYEIEPLLKLRDQLSDDERSRVVLICTDVYNLPVKKKCADLAFAWGLLSCLSNMHQGLDFIGDLTDNSGLMFFVEPLLEHALVYSLIKQDINEFYDIMTSRTRSSSWQDKSCRYRIYSLDELTELFSNKRYVTLYNGGVSVLPSLLFGGILDSNSKELSEMLKGELFSLIKSLDFSWNRQQAWLLQFAK